MRKPLPAIASKRARQAIKLVRVEGLFLFIVVTFISSSSKLGPHLEFSGEALLATTVPVPVAPNIREIACVYRVLPRFTIGLEVGLASQSDGMRSSI
jgi:hypothetical protein